MARGIKLKECKYEIDTFVGVATARKRVVLNACFIKMDQYNVGTTDKLIKESTSAITPIPFNTSLRKNKNQIGIHPRHLICEYKPEVAAGVQGACFGTQPKRLVIIPVLTLSQFDIFQAYDKKLGGDQANTLITVNHSFNGAFALDYRIIQKVDQVLI